MICYIVYKCCVDYTDFCSERCFKNLFLSYFIIYLFALLCYFAVGIDIFDVNKYLYIFLVMLALIIELIISCLFINPFRMRVYNNINNIEEVI